MVVWENSYEFVVILPEISGNIGNFGGKNSKREEREKEGEIRGITIRNLKAVINSVAGSCLVLLGTRQCKIR
ncbi:hypothetical protein NECAME_17639 [Necator americanus]|uniref:Uncharacterized protein n=1 Tax=Necator americanus TaxID=51031 RepID=W2TNS8_NECAM|nr:hypothetical protein NECAME_17639 [Necator americanus]ETN82761.1 hypothetical protein NECAME_17639 [Necator americanus]